MLSGLRSVIYVLLPINEKLKSISPPWSKVCQLKLQQLWLKENEYYENCYTKTHVLREEFSKELSKINSITVVQKACCFVLCYLRRWSKC
jgi:histidinol-phosphate/aromatic aminotransferase/cobyric acid decarboxylase-like protein